MYRISRVKVLRLMLDRWETVEQKELADRVGMQEATISRLFGGQAFTAETLTKFCKALQCTPNDILELEPDADQPAPKGDAQAPVGVGLAMAVS